VADELERVSADRGAAVPLELLAEPGILRDGVRGVARQDFDGHRYV